MIARMRTLGFRTLLPAFVDPMPERSDTVSLADFLAARDKLVENHVPPFKCEACSEQVYALVLPEEKLPEQWRCGNCGHANRIESSERAAGCLLGQARDAPSSSGA